MPHVIVALDVPTAEEAMALVDALGPRLTFVKVGLELHTREGVRVVEALRARGLRIFLDLKLHDIPATVAGAVRSAGMLGVDLLTVHGSGGRRMLEAAAAAAPPGLTLLAVTVLTSMAEEDLAEAWGRTDASLEPRREVVRLAAMAQQAGIPGVVASPQEAGALRALLGPEAPIVTPGIRLPGGAAHDQRRIATPAQAVAVGASHLVIGRPITEAADPAQVLEAILDEVGA
jgi:orotidine-5'-phosphate decarboxylase